MKWHGVPTGIYRHRTTYLEIMAAPKVRAQIQPGFSGGAYRWHH